MQEWGSQEVALGDTAVAGWARSALTSLSDRADVSRVGLALVEGGGRRLQFTASDRLGDEHDVEWCYLDAYDDVPLTAMLRSGRPVLGTLDELAGRFQAFVEGQRRTTTVALAAVPVVAEGQVLGGVLLYFDRPQTFGDTERRTLSDAGAALGSDLRRAQRTRTRAGSVMTLVDEPTPDGATVAVHDVPQDHAAISGARRFLSRTLDEWGVDEEVADSAVLCLSELVTNAVIHTLAGCSVRVRLEQGVLTVSVRDGGPAESEAVALPEDLLRVHGRGLQIVEALADRWGSDLDTVGTTVWATFDTRRGT